MSSNINRDYLIKLNVKTSSYQAPNIYFYNTDKATSNIYVQLIVHETLLDVTAIEQASNYRIKVNIIKPNNVVKTLYGTLVNEEDSIFEFNLPKDCTNLSGTYHLEFMVICDIDNYSEEITTSFPATYEVRKSILTGLVAEIVDSEDITTLEDMLTKLANKFDDVKVDKNKTTRDKIVVNFYSDGAIIKTIELNSTSSEIVKVNTIEERDALDSSNLRLGDFCYVIEDVNEIYIYYYSTNGWTSMKPKHPVEISDTAPTNKQALWIDTSNMNANPDVSDDNVPPTIRYLLNKISDLTSEINLLKNEIAVIKTQIENGGGIINPTDNVYLATEEGDMFITEDSLFIISEEGKSDEPTNGVMLITETGESIITEDGKYFIQEG